MYVKFGGTYADVRADFVLGCDGARSRVRRICLDDGDPLFDVRRLLPYFCFCFPSCLFWLPPCPFTLSPRGYDGARCLMLRVCMDGRLSLIKVRSLLFWFAVLPVL